MSDNELEVIAQSIKDCKSKDIPTTHAILQAIQLGYSLGLADSKKAG